jgi:hypothetical protein
MGWHQQDVNVFFVKRDKELETFEEIKNVKKIVMKNKRNYCRTDKKKKKLK